MQNCVKNGPDIIDKVESDIGSLRHILKADIIPPRTHQRLRLLLTEDLPELIREARELRGTIGRQYLASVDYEYGIETEVISFPNRRYVVGRYFPQNVRDDIWYFGDKEERQIYMEKLRKEIPYMEFWLVKRRKAGKVERV
jgi:hypothetical protein